MSIDPPGNKPRRAGGAAALRLTGLLCVAMTGPAALGADDARLATDAVSVTEVTRGRTLFAANCAHCHADDASGDEGPDLRGIRKSDERIRQVVLAGIAGEMPAFGKKLSAADTRALADFLRSLPRPAGDDK